MSLPRQSVERPIFTTMVVLIVIILGSLALSRLPVDLMPDITYPTLSISTTYSNASPVEVEQLISRPIEQALAAVPGVQSITSESGEGNSIVRLSFNWGTDLNEASNDLRDRLDRVITALPDGASRPALRKFDLSAMPILEIGVTSALDPLDLRNLISDQIEYRLERVPGIAAISVRGGLSREIHINLNPVKIKGLKISMDQIINAIKASNVNLPAGSVQSGNSEISIRTPGEFTDLEQLRNTIVFRGAGSVVTLGQIADVDDSWAKITRHTRINGQNGVQISLNKQSGTNTVAVAKAAMQELEKINRDIPQVTLIPLMDSSVFINRSIKNVGQSAILGGFLAILVLLLFLRNLKSTTVIASSIPVSVVATFGLIYFGGFTLNLMTLGGLALGVGMLLDNSIVVLENIFRLRENGMDAKEAAIKGSEEVTAPIIASTLTTLVVFLPLIFVRGMSGVMFKQLSYVIAFSIFCSLFTALTLVPMLSARMLSIRDKSKNPTKGFVNLLNAKISAFLESLDEAYKKILHKALRHRTITIIMAVTLLAGSMLLIPFVGSELMPEADEGEIRINLEMEAGTKLDITHAKMLEVEKIVQNSVPELNHLVLNTGGPGWRGPVSHTGNLRISLKPQNLRTRSSEEVANDLRAKLNNIPGTKIRVRPTAGLMVFRRMQADAGRLELIIRGYNLEEAASLAVQIQTIVDNTDGVTDSSISRNSGSLEQLVMVDRQKAAELGLSVENIARMLQTLLAGSRAGYYREDGKEYPIVVQLAEEDKGSLEDVLNLSIINNSGQAVVLRNVVNIISGIGNTQIDRQDQERVTTISANISGRDMSSIISDIRGKLQNIAIPSDFSVVFGGDFEEQQRSFRELMLGFALALILVYMVMACLYESLRDPFVVMFSVPFAIIGVVLMLFLSGTTFNVQSYIGIIMLGGIVVNNAILLVDTTNLLRREEGLSVRDAIEEAGKRRLRPILMTASTTVLAMIPMAIGIGEGGEAQAPLARAVVGGMISSALITLVFVPVIYSIFEGLKSKQ